MPRASAQIRGLTAASRVLTGADPRLVAMRAAFSLPYAQLLAYTKDPLGDLASEHDGQLVDARSRRPACARRRLQRASSGAPTVDGGSLEAVT